MQKRTLNVVSYFLLKRKLIYGLSILSIIFFILFSFQSCTGQDDPSDSSDSDSQSIPDDIEDLVENSEFTYKVTISLGSSLSINNPAENNGVSISQSNEDVIIKSTLKDVEYVLSGTLTNGGVKIYSDNKFKLTLNGVNITNSDGPAINIQSKKRIFMVLADNTQNTLSDGATYATSSEDQKGTLFSEGQLIFSGNGALTVAGKYKHAICTDDYIRIRSGSINITEAVADGIHTNDAVVIDGGTLNINSSSDGIECDEGFIKINDGNITIKSADDGITASYEGTSSTINPYTEINGGNINITTSGESGKGIKSRGDLTINDGKIIVSTSKSEAEGIESKTKLTINNGTIEVSAYDDCINAKTSIIINGGQIYCYSATNDGIDSNGTMTVTGGTIVSAGSTAPEEGMDCDNNTFKITGGTIISMGGATSTPTSNVCTQYSAIIGSVGTANQLVHIESANGDQIITFKNPRAYSTLLFTSPGLAANTSYVIYTGGSISGGSDFHGLYSNTTYSSGTKSATFTTSSIVTTVGNVSGGGGRP
jgi:hypothetical protein